MKIKNEIIMILIEIIKLKWAIKWDCLIIYKILLKDLELFILLIILVYIEQNLFKTQILYWWNYQLMINRNNCRIKISETRYLC